jgi:hypothetical protein
MAVRIAKLWSEYLNEEYHYEDRMLQKKWENFTTNTSITCTLNQTLLGYWNQRQWDGKECVMHGTDHNFVQNAGHKPEGQRLPKGLGMVGRITYN